MLLGVAPVDNAFAERERELIRLRTLHFTLALPACALYPLIPSPTHNHEPLAPVCVIGVLTDTVRVGRGRGRAS